MARRLAVKAFSSFFLAGQGQMGPQSQGRRSRANRPPGQGLGELKRKW